MVGTMVDKEHEQSGSATPSDKFAKAVEVIHDIDGNYDDAIDLLTEVLEQQSEKYGDLALECAPALYYYGVALFNKARLENDVFGEPVQKAMVEKAIHQMKQEAERNAKEAEKASGPSKDANKEGAAAEAENAAEVDDEGEDVDEEAEEDLEDEENDMELAWRNLETARLIYSKHPGKEKELADVYAALAELSMEREDFETSIADFKSALEVLQTSKDPHVDRILAEYYYKLCIALQLYGGQQSHEGNKAASDGFLKDAVTYCEKALAILDNELARTKEAEDGGDAKAKELEAIMTDIKDKVDELHESMKQREPMLVGGASTSQIGFDKGTSRGKGKADLGVVGRGVNRVSL
eukprot:CAMPEP_0198236898 /NCGR_PEP_ID=MMETSP1446-20131203/2798_1 /TAXON_ID=1461542 ORGANISM="Unidentified sp, Strain CCMP2111" /NCGR_SAMPLE_ID=MMETSP1446 /ASSEMBLY_ACC=CAM_ASM_001112 /LENGTH=351 /DNA_ID=CAMNT_0043918875 /DNA_START=1 /DNA_END=1052 /DNA_ORIENTATION=+